MRIGESHAARPAAATVPVLFVRRRSATRRSAQCGSRWDCRASARWPSFRGSVGQSAKRWRNWPGSAPGLERRPAAVSLPACPDGRPSPLWGRPRPWSRRVASPLGSTLPSRPKFRTQLSVEGVGRPSSKLATPLPAGSGIAVRSAARGARSRLWRAGLACMAHLTACGRYPLRRGPATPSRPVHKPDSTTGALDRRQSLPVQYGLSASARASVATLAVVSVLRSIARASSGSRYCMARPTAALPRRAPDAGACQDTARFAISRFGSPIVLVAVAGPG